MARNVYYGSRQLYPFGHCLKTYPLRLPGAGLGAIGRGSAISPFSLRRRAEASDAVTPTAFNHGFTKFKATCEADRKVIETLVPVLAGLSRPCIRVSHSGIETLRFVPKSN
jgi:hypothetical protein